MTKTTAWMAGLMVVAVSASQPPVASPNLFSADERAALVDFWSAPNRYQVSIPDDVAQKGLWQVRLTVPGSKWLWDYNRKRNLIAPPGQVPKPENAQQVEWEKWVVARLARDRWEAWQLARAQNQKVLNALVPGPDKTIPSDEPARPGPMPQDLADLVGDVPKLAEAVVPMQHTVAFDDVTLKYRDNVRVSSPRYPYYRFEKGVNSEGVPMIKMPPAQLDKLFEAANMTDRECRVMRAVSELEGGFDSVNTYDTGFVSVGFIQFASLKDGANSFGTLLKAYKADDPDHFAADFHRFGIDVTDAGALEVVDPATGAELTAGVAAMKAIEDPRLIAIFQRAGLKSQFFVAAQIRAAKSMYWPESDSVKVTLADGTTLSGRISDFIKSEAGLATVMDRKVNTSRLDVLVTALSQLSSQFHPRSLSDFAPYERQIVQKIKYRRDFLADEDLSQPLAGPGRVVPPVASRGGGRRRSGG